MTSRAWRSRRRPRPEASPRLLHHLQALLALAGRPAGKGPGEADFPGRSERRRRQHLELTQRLLDPLPAALRPSGGAAERFWRALRWGGCGMLIAHFLGR